MAKQELTGGSKILEILKDFPGERLLMGFLGTLIIVFGVYFIIGINAEDTTQIWLQITPKTDWWNKWVFGTETRILVFSWTIIVLGTVALVMAIWPFLLASRTEMGKVTWPNAKTIRNHSARVYGFILFLIVMFIIFEAGLTPLFKWLKGM